jgi:drug/metabolite transporter superfamily protein YnfA
MPMANVAGACGGVFVVSARAWLARVDKNSANKDEPAYWMKFMVVSGSKRHISL